MELMLADNPAIIIVSWTVEKTIQKINSRYYPSGAMRFFLELHSEERIKEVTSSEAIYLVMVQENIKGTGSIRKNLQGDYQWSNELLSEMKEQRIMPQWKK